MGRSYLSYLGSQRSPQISNFIIIFWQNARWTLKPLHLDQIKLFNKSKNTLSDYFLMRLFYLRVAKLQFIV